MSRYVQRIEELMRQNRHLKPVLITLTVKNGSDLQERFKHLRASFRTLLDRYNDYKKKVVVLISFVKLMALFIQLNIHTIQKLKNGILIFIFLLYLMNG